MASWTPLELKSCEACGNETMLRPEVKTCSKSCRTTLVHRNRQSNAPFGTCVICGTIGKLPNHSKGANLCSSDCRIKFLNRNVSGKRKINGKTTSDKLPERECVQCKTKFKPFAVFNVYCSKECRYKHNGKTYRATGTLRRQKIRELLAVEIGKCCLCGTSHEEIVPASEFGILAERGKAKFHNDHITPKARGGDNSPENKRWLCWYCNMSRNSMDVIADPFIAAGGRAFWEEYKNSLK